MEAQDGAGSMEMGAHEVNIEDALQRFEDRLHALPATTPEKVDLVESATRALAHSEEHVAAIITALTGGRRPSAKERVLAEVEVLKRSFLRRHELLADSLPTAEVAKLLNTSRQTPHDRVKSGTLLAIMDNGTLRFPIWQFDPEGEDGVVKGLPAVIRSLDVSNLAKLSWLIRENLMLDGETPLACLRSGQTERVVALARAVGAG